MKTTDASSAPAVGSVATGRWVRGLRWLERTCFALLLFAGIFNFPNNPEASLDPSWRLVLARAFYDGLQFGRDIVFASTKEKRTGPATCMMSGLTFVRKPSTVLASTTTQPVWKRGSATG